MRGKQKGLQLDKEAGDDAAPPGADTDNGEQLRATQIFEVMDEKAIFAFLEEKDDINFIGKHGETALNWACFKCNVLLVEQLLALKADPNHCDKVKYRSPVAWVLKSQERNETKKQQILSLLRAAGANLVSSPDHNGETSLSLVGDNLALQRLLSDASLFGLIDGQDKANERMHPGDDSSDEESVKESVSNFDFKKQWESVRQSKDYLSLLESPEISDESMRLCFFVHASGLNLLYSPRVNELYYNASFGKRSLGPTTIQQPLGEDGLEECLRRSIRASIQNVIYLGDEIKRQEEEASKEFVSDLITFVLQDKNERIFQQDFKINRQRLMSLAIGLDLDGKTQKRLRKGRHSDSAGYSKNKDGRKGYQHEKAKSLSSGEKGKRVAEANACVRALTQYLSNGISSNQEQEEYFRLYFFEMLKKNLDGFGYVLNRGALELPLPLRPFSYNKGSLGLFCDIRRLNRLRKRKARHLQDRMVAYNSQCELKQAEEVSLGHYDHCFSHWELLKGVMVVFKDEISTNFVRKAFLCGRHASYTSINLELEKVKAKISIEKPDGLKRQLNDVDIAKLIRLLIQGEFAYFVNLSFEHGERMQGAELAVGRLLNIVSHLSFLLFICEPIRNPASFCVHQMMLDLILHKTFTWEACLKDELMPMSTGGAVSDGRYVQSLFKNYLPFPYCYEGASDKEPPVQMIKDTASIVRQWNALQISLSPSPEGILEDGLDDDGLGLMGLFENLEVSKARKAQYDLEMLPEQVDRAIAGEWFKWPAVFNSQDVATSGGGATQQQSHAINLESEFGS